VTLKKQNKTNTTTKQNKKNTMSLSSTSNSLIQTKSLIQQQPHSSLTNQSSFPIGLKPKPNHKPKPNSIVAVHAAEPAKNPVVTEKPSKQPQPTTIPRNVASTKWTIDSWKSKKALQLPEYPNQEELESVLKTLDDFPPIVFAGEARTLEEHLGDAAMGNAFLLQGGDCAESFKEFNANNIRDTFRIILQMSVVMMFGGQMPVIKVTPKSFLVIKSL
jgi:3-deoxy-7-phosphoheptulonate synthase